MLHSDHNLDFNMRKPQRKEGLWNVIDKYDTEKFYINLTM